MTQEATNRQFRKAAADLFDPALTSYNLQYSYGALDSLVHQKNVQQHELGEVITVDFHGPSGLLLTTKIQQLTSDVLFMTIDGRPGKHRGADTLVAYLQPLELTPDEASDGLYAAEVIRHMTTMVIEGTAVLSVALEPPQK